MTRMPVPMKMRTMTMRTETMKGATGATGARRRLPMLQRFSPWRRMEQVRVVDWMQRVRRRV